MSNPVTLDTFPSNKYEALAMLFLDNQDLSDKEPEDVLDMFEDAYARMRKQSKAKRDASRQIR